jgi:hypothetical protein
MSRRIIKNKVLLTEFFNTVINEIFDKKIETAFKEVDYGEYIAYKFKTDSGLSYDLEFHYSSESCDTLLNNEIELKDLLINECDKGYINCFDIAFTLSMVYDKDNPNEFEKETNKHEHFELMGRISFIINKLIKKYSKIKLFVVGNSKRNKNEIYKKVFENHFNDKFQIFNGISKWHNGESFFIIRKNNIV